MKPPDQDLAGSTWRPWSALRGVCLVGVLLIGGGFKACERFRKEPWETAPLRRDEVETTPLPERAKLAVDRVRFYSNEMKEPRFFLALLPKTEPPPRDVFILNHGWFDRPEFLLTELKVDQIYAELLEQKKVRPAVVVLPDVRFDDFYRRNREKFPFPNYLTLVAEETSRVVSQKYRVPFSRDHWSLGGFSFGGYLSLDVARRYSGRFGSVSVLSSFAEKEWTFWPSAPPPAGKLDAQGRGRQTVVEPGPAPRIFLACGKDDRLFGRMLALHENFNRLGVAHEWSTGPGGHTWEYWSSVLRPMLEFHLAAEVRR